MFCSKCGKNIGDLKICECTLLNEIGVSSTNIEYGDKEFIFEAQMGRLFTIKGFEKVFKTIVNCSQDTLKFTQSKGRYAANDKKAKIKVVQRPHIVSIDTSKKYNIGLIFVSLFFLFSAFILGPWFLVLFIVAALGVTNKVIIIKLSNGEKIEIRYSKSCPHEEFLAYLNN